MNLSDKTNVDALIKGCIKNDRKSQKILYKTFYSKMLGVCMRYSSDSEAAKDVLHEGFIKVFDKLKSFENKGSLEGWVRRIIVNTAIDNVRKKDKLVFTLDDENYFESINENSDVNFISDDDGNVDGRKLLELMQKLKPSYRTVLNLYVIENYSHNEIAKELNISVGTSKSSLARAKMKLKELLLNCKAEV